MKAIITLYIDRNSYIYKYRINLYFKCNSCVFGKLWKFKKVLMQHLIIFQMLTLILGQKNHNCWGKIDIEIKKMSKNTKLI